MCYLGQGLPCLFVPFGDVYYSNIEYGESGEVTPFTFISGDLYLRPTSDKHIYLRWTAPIDMTCNISYQITGYFEAVNTGVESMSTVYLRHNNQELQVQQTSHGSSSLIMDTIDFTAGDQLDLVSTITQGEIDGSVRLSGGLSCVF